MRSIIGRNLLNLCFTNFKRSIPIEPTYFYQEEDDDQYRKRSVNTSVVGGGGDGGDGDSTITKTFNSLYDLTSSIPKPLRTHISSSTFSDDVNSIESPETIPDIATVYASQRFFFASPGRSNSIVDSSSSSLSLTSPSSSNPPEEEGEESPEIGGVAVPTYSPDPYLDFRRSMEEMVEARNLFDVRSNWECLHELLLCYLALNPKSNHKFIVGAFSDLLVSLMDSQSGYSTGAGCIATATAAATAGGGSE
ncbi:transcription repressor OFP12-like [Impatiens glandulifera]|uniref:transcription repressor OFP12-like n=1 Tax=Impatiens glandulifera TaxID=253017 RepID=UPI001FB0818E|nr:transcription repressor OFP12-like [Impatiens glandulifera]